MAIFFRSSTSEIIASLLSTVPFSQLKPAMYRLVEPSGRVVSMNVRLQLFSQKWQTVSSSFLLVYSRSIAASIPMNVERPRRLTTRSVSIAAPMAPASPVCGCT